MLRETLVPPTAHQEAGGVVGVRGEPPPGQPDRPGRSAYRKAARPLRHRSPANQARHDHLPLGARIADRVTAVFGSWGFILIQTALIVVWLGYNGYAAVHYLHSRQFDPYPFILLNLLFSTQAAYAAPLILLSQNRTTERDRVKAEHDFDVNVLALRSLAEILGDIHDPTAQQRLRTRIEDLLGSDPEKGVDPPTVPAPTVPAPPATAGSAPRGVPPVP